MILQCEDITVMSCLFIKGLKFLSIYCTRSSVTLARGFSGQKFICLQDTKIQRYKDTKIQRYKDTKIQRYNGYNCLRRQFSHNTGITCPQYPTVC